jgi:hypothetical protein
MAAGPRLRSSPSGTRNQAFEIKPVRYEKSGRQWAPRALAKGDSDWAEVMKVGFKQKLQEFIPGKAR